MCLTLVGVLCVHAVGGNRFNARFMSDLSYHNYEIQTKIAFTSVFKLLFQFPMFL